MQGRAACHTTDESSVRTNPYRTNEMNGQAINPQCFRFEQVPYKHPPWSIDSGVEHGRVLQIRLPGSTPFLGHIMFSIKRCLVAALVACLAQITHGNPVAQAEIEPAEQVIAPTSPRFTISSLGSNRTAQR
jgi:hypothetical protein